MDSSETLANENLKHFTFGFAFELVLTSDFIFYCLDHIFRFGIGFVSVYLQTHLAPFDVVNYSVTIRRVKQFVLFFFNKTLYISFELIGDAMSERSL